MYSTPARKLYEAKFYGTKYNLKILGQISNSQYVHGFGDKHTVNKNKNCLVVAEWKPIL
jgi:hypothetical protein